MSYKSYAENYEDAVLRRAFKDISQGFYIDLAPGDPAISSVTRGFYEAGWRGAHLVFDLTTAERIRIEQTDDVVINANASDVSAKTEITTAAHALFKKFKTREVHWLRIGRPNAVDVVLEGLENAPTLPWLILVAGAAAARGDWRHQLHSKGYRGAYFDGSNAFFIADAHKERFAAFLISGQDSRSFPADYASHPNVGEPSAPVGEAEVERLRDQLQETRKALETKAREVRKLSWEAARAAGLEERLNAIYQSNSWRITAVSRNTITAVKNALNSTHSFVQKLQRDGLHRPKQKRQAADAAATVKKSGHLLYVYVDHTVDCPVNTGVQRVVRGLTRGLMEVGQHPVFVRWSRAHRALVRIDREQLRRLGEWNGPAPEKIAKEYPQAGDNPLAIEICGGWLVIPEVTHLNFHEDAPTLDVIMTAKRANLKTACIFYDAIPLIRPEHAATARQHEDYMRALSLVDFIAPISAWSGTDLTAYFAHHESYALQNIPPITPILLPAPLSVTPASKAATAKSQSKHNARTILCVGTIEERKNQLTLIHAFQRFKKARPQDGWRLIFVGNLHPEIAAKIRDAVAEDTEIEISGPISDEKLRALYQSCAFTVFPSIEEGYGLPILESLNFGKPCVCASFGSMGEIAASGGALTIDICDEKSLHDAIVSLADDGALRAKLSKAAMARAKTDWRDYARTFLSELNKVANAAGRLGPVYYWTDATCRFPANTGIQRVVRSLARSLMNNGVELTPVKWDAAARNFMAVDASDRDHLQKWEGPDARAWRLFNEAGDGSNGGWLLIPEVLSDPEGPRIDDIYDRAKKLGLKVAWIFYDAIPWKLDAYYSDRAAKLHAEYMSALAPADRIFPISQTSSDDLLRFLSASPERTPSLFERIDVQPLPAELPGAARRMTGKEPDHNNIVRLLTVGTVEPRKNHLTLLHAFKLAQQALGEKASITLTIVGNRPDPSLAKDVQRLIDDISGVDWLVKTDDDELKRLYEAADFTVYPSIEEGFGLPILESLWNARPCICRDQGSMAELAVGGGCLTVDTTDARALSEAIVRLATDETYRQQLARDAINREFTTWSDYATGIAAALGEASQRARATSPTLSQMAFEKRFINLNDRPLLTIAVTTYNRAEWLACSLKNLARLIPTPTDNIEIVVCDNASTDETQSVAAQYSDRQDFQYYRNETNVGMLGNLRVTAHHAKGRYIWIVGDDDLIADGAIEHITDSLTQQLKDDCAPTLLYLNYAYHREDDPSSVGDLCDFINRATPITPPGEDVNGPISTLSTLSENFFTAIYCLVLRRDHALRAYSQNTGGPPFSSMATSIPTTNHVLHHMMHEPGLWLGTPCVAINMNVSWMRYAPIWTLERLPEVFDVAEMMGAAPEEVDRWRINQLAGIEHWWAKILQEAPDGPNRKHFDPRRLFTRYKHLPEFRRIAPALLDAYARGWKKNAHDLQTSPEQLRSIINNFL